jgi:DNA repair exonuclease SbcCD ATPase subunit/predicted MPP superfamily phosphohydrolase
MDTNNIEIISADNNIVSVNNNVDSNTTNIKTTVVQYRSIIKYIFHISDLHIHLYKRHIEYKEVFNNLFDRLKEEKRELRISEDKNKNIPVVTVITGDILHCKSDLSPECVDLTYQFIKELSGIMPVIIIPGNHDINMNNKDRMDSLTPIIADLPELYPIYYLSTTGVWIFNNIVIAHSSIYDYKIIKRTELDDIIKESGHQFTKTAEKNLRYINLFHGRINGVELYNGIALTGEIDRTTNKTITITAFDGYNLSLFGDVHRHHFLSDTQAYAGSLIQQNYGETNLGHGMIKWDIIKRKGEFIEIDNNYGYYTIKVIESKINDTDIVDIDINEFINVEGLNADNLRLRIYYYKTEKSLLYDFVNRLKERKTLMELTYQEDASLCKAVVSTDTGDGEEAETDAANRINIYDIEYQNSLLREILINEEGLDAEENAEEIDAILQINKEYNKLLDISNLNQGSGQKFKLLTLSYENLFSFSGGNFIDFTNMRGIVGIIAPNHTGKSAILDIILYMLYDKFSRKGSIKDMINNRKSSYSAKLEVLMNGYIYTIVKSGELTTKGSITKTECQFSKTHSISGRIERLEKDNAKKTKDFIKTMFGDYEDAINTTFSIQTDATGFIDSENTKRRAELERILRMDFLNVIYKKALGQYKDNKAVFEHLQKTMSSETIIAIQEQIAEYEAELETGCEKQSSITAKCKDLQDKINELNKEYDTSVDKKIADFTSDLNTDEIDDEAINKRYEELKTEITSVENTIGENNKKIAKYLKKCRLDNITDIDKAVNDLKARKIDFTKKSNANYLESEKLQATIIKCNDTRTIEELKAELSAMKSSDELKADIETQKKKVSKYEKKILTTENELQRLMLPTELEKYISDYQTKKEVFMQFISKLDIKSLSNDKSEFNRLIENAKEFGFIEGLYNHSSNSNGNKSITEKIEDYKRRIKISNDKLTELEEEIKKLEELSKIITIKEKNYLTNIELNRLDDIETSINNELEQIDKELDYINKLQSLVLKDKELQIEVRELNVKLANIESVSAELDKLIERLERNKTIQLDIKELTGKLSIEKEQHHVITKEIDNARDNICKLQGQIERMRKDAIEKREKETLMNQYKKYASAMKIMPFRLLKNIQISLEQRINDLLSVITNFTLKINITDKSIDIYLDRSRYGKKKIIINNCSGFERFISSLAIRMALLDITQLPSGNFMAIDEGWSCFDKENIANMDIILNYLCQKFDFILTISHLQEIKQHCDIQMNLKRDENGFSQINYS